METLASVILVISLMIMLTGVLGFSFDESSGM
jgi:hypothetical protein